MFSGTVRTNLDPFGEFGHDAVLWETIKDVGLEEQVGWVHYLLRLLQLAGYCHIAAAS